MSSVFTETTAMPFLPSTSTCAPLDRLARLDRLHEDVVRAVGVVLDQQAEIGDENEPASASRSPRSAGSWRIRSPSLIGHVGASDSASRCRRACNSRRPSPALRASTCRMNRPELALVRIAAIDELGEIERRVVVLRRVGIGDALRRMICSVMLRLVKILSIERPDSGNFPPTG